MKIDQEIHYTLEVSENELTLIETAINRHFSDHESDSYDSEDKQTIKRIKHAIKGALA